jgi:hypothetical protein
MCKRKGGSIALTIFLDNILNVLSDGKYKAFRTIKANVRSQNEQQIILALKFLAQYGFIELFKESFSEKPRGAQLSGSMMRFVRNIQMLEDAEQDPTEKALELEQESSDSSEYLTAKQKAKSEE